MDNIKDLFETLGIAKQIQEYRSRGLTVSEIKEKLEHLYGVSFSEDDLIQYLEVESETKTFASEEEVKPADILAPKDVEILQELLNSLYHDFRLADSPKQRAGVAKLIVALLDLKWRYLGLERKTATIDENRLKEALKKAGVKVQD